MKQSGVIKIVVAVPYQHSRIKESILDGNYRTRQKAIKKCYYAAKKRGFKVFAVQDGGWCASSLSAAKTFNKYGRSSACRQDGEGGPWANQVYYIKG